MKLSLNSLTQQSALTGLPQPGIHFYYHSAHAELLPSLLTWFCLCTQLRAPQGAGYQPILTEQMEYTNLPKH